MYAFNCRPVDGNDAKLQTSEMFASNVNLETALITTASNILSMDIDITQFPESWIRSVDSVLEFHQLERDRRELSINQRIFVCGAKGVGKSSCIRYTINRCLKIFQTIAVIDCDLGQPEFNG